MTISDLIKYAEAKLATLAIAHTTATREGDVDRIAQIEADIAETEATLATLRAVAV